MHDGKKYNCTKCHVDLTNKCVGSYVCSQCGQISCSTCTVRSDTIKDETNTLYCLQCNTKDKNSFKKLSSLYTYEKEKQGFHTSEGLKTGNVPKEMYQGKNVDLK